MSVIDILEQVKTLTHEERKQVAKAVIDLLDTPSVQAISQPTEHWGQNLLRLLDELEPIETAHPEIEDPVEWVKTMRREARQRRLGENRNTPLSSSSPSS
jgi:hypothetical protein